MAIDVKYSVSVPEIFRKEGVIGQLMIETLNKVGDDLREYLYGAVFRGKPYIRYERRQDQAGKSLVSYQVWRKGQNINLSISSYPNNLFERGRRLRSGKQQSPLNIFTKVLPPIANQILQRRKRILEEGFTKP